MRFGLVQPKETPADYGDLVDFAVRERFDWVEFKIEPGMSASGVPAGRSARTWGDRLAARGIGVSVHARHKGVNIGALDADELDVAKREYWRSLDFARDLGATHVTLHGGNVPLEAGTAASPETLERMKARTVETLSALVLDAHSLGITVSLENLTAFASTEKHRWPRHPHEMVECRDAICRASRSWNVSFTIDTGHLHGFGYRPEAFARQIGADAIALAHIHDNDGTADQHGPPGAGTIDFDAFLTAYLDGAWRFPWLFEVRERAQALEARRWIASRLHVLSPSVET